MITGRAGEQVEVTLEGVTPGLVGTVALAIVDREGTEVVARSTVGISEVDSSGVYLAAREAPDDAGNYVLLWDTGLPRADDNTFTEDLRVYEAPPFDFLPDASDIGAIMRARTQTDRGDELGGFTENTRPTEAEVTAMIFQAAAEMAGTIGSTFEDPDLRESVRSAVKMRTAMLVELSFWPEQVAGDRSPYANYKAMFDEHYTDLKQAAAEGGAGDDPSVADNLKEPVYEFAEDEGGLIGWETRW